MTYPRDEQESLPQSERMSDVSDLATQREAEFLSDAIKRSQIAIEQKQKPRPDGSYEFEDCDECGQPIGQERLRLAANNLTCVHCQSEIERRRKLFT